MNTLHIILGAGLLWLLVAAAICIYLCLLFDDQAWQQAYEERRAAPLSRGATNEASRVSQGNGYSSRASVPAPAEWHLREEEIDFVLPPYQQLLSGGRTRERRHR